MIKLKDLLSEASLVGYDKSYLDNAKKKLKVSHEITDIEYKKTRQHDKFVKISYKLKWKPGTRLDTEEKDVNVFYDSPERLKMIGKTLKLKLKESVKEAVNETTISMGHVHSNPYVHSFKSPEQIEEIVARPFSEHLRKAQEQIEWMIGEHNDAEDEGVYGNPKQAIKLLQTAQKALGKIK
jgi:hypothetical protein